MLKKDAKIFIAGAHGLVGSALVQQLRMQGYNRLLTPTHADLDLLDPAAARWFFSVFTPEIVFFCAAVVGGIADNVSRKLMFLADNQKIQLNVITNAANYGCKKLVFVGTSCCYPRDCPQPMAPESLWTGKLEPTTEAYSIAKLAGIKLCQYYNEQGHDFISVLPCNVYGPHDNFDPETAHCLPGMMARMHATKLENAPTFSIWGDGKQRREFIFSESLARGLILAAERYDWPEPLNLGSGLELSMEELAIVLRSVVGYEGKFVFDPSRPTGATRKLLDSSLARALGFSPGVQFIDTIRQTYNWFLANKLDEKGVQK